MCSLKDYEQIVICQEHMQGVTQELENWHKYLLPRMGRNQLDIGAGCGETAFFYLNHGAERVICVEGNKACLENLRSNFGNHHRVTIIPHFVENIKVDIDGGEKNMIIETHFPYRMRRLQALNRYTSLNILEEYWGNPLRKLLRKFGRRFY